MLIAACIALDYSIESTKSRRQHSIVMKFGWPDYLPLALIVAMILGVVAMGLTVT
jgi:hypothetical protein